MMVGAKQTLQLTCHFLVTSVIGETLSGHSGLHRIYRICWFQLSDESCRLCNLESADSCVNQRAIRCWKNWQVSCRSTLTNSKSRKGWTAAGCERCQSLLHSRIILTTHLVHLVLDSDLRNLNEIPLGPPQSSFSWHRLHVLLLNVTVGTKIACTTVDGKNPAVTSWYDIYIYISHYLQDVFHQQYVFTVGICRCRIQFNLDQFASWNMDVDVGNGRSDDRAGFSCTLFGEDSLVDQYASIWVAQPPQLRCLFWKMRMVRLIFKTLWGAHMGDRSKNSCPCGGTCQWSIPFVDGQNVQKTVQTAETLVKYAMR